MLGLLLLTAPSAGAQLVPNDRWLTFETSHFRIHFTAPLEEQARRAAANAELAYAQMSRELVPPRGMIELVVADNLDAPSSLAFFREEALYVAESTRVIRLSIPDANGAYQERSTIINDLPDGGHSTRTLLFSADWSKLYVAIGSSCNVCNEDDEPIAT